MMCCDWYTRTCVILKWAKDVLLVQKETTLQDIRAPQKSGRLHNEASGLLSTLHLPISTGFIWFYKLQFLTLPWEQFNDDGILKKLVELFKWHKNLPSMFRHLPASVKWVLKLERLKHPVCWALPFDEKEETNDELDQCALQVDCSFSQSSNHQSQNVLDTSLKLVGNKESANDLYMWWTRTKVSTSIKEPLW